VITIPQSLIKIDNFLPQNDDEQLEQMILSDLTSPQKKISSMFFYDAKGSHLFEQITGLPEYYLTRTEITLLHEIVEDLRDHCHHIDLIEFGSGDCKKISILLDTLPKESLRTIRYIPFDVSIDAIKKSSEILSKRYPDLHIHGIVADFNTQLDVIWKDTKKIICFLGSTIGNFSPIQASAFLTDLQRIMNPDDLLLIGFDRVKQKEVIESAYNDMQLLTEQFNKNILQVVNNLISTDFDPDLFDHIAFYNEESSRIEMHLKAQRDLEISCPGLSSPLTIKKNETIHTENSYKFSEEHINRLAEHTGLRIKRIISDENQWFSLVLFSKNRRE
jgi:L-histidine Nalpha-methyltransferase